MDCLAASVFFQDRTRINIIIFTLQKKLSNLVTVTQVLINIPLLIHRRTFYSTKFIRQLKLLFKFNTRYYFNIKIDYLEFLGCCRKHTIQSWPRLPGTTVETAREQLLLSELESE